MTKSKVMDKEFILAHNSRGISVHHGVGSMPVVENGEITSSNEKMKPTHSLQAEQIGSRMRL